MDTFLVGIGFKVLKSDPYIYILNETTIIKRVAHYDISYAIKWLARAMYKSSKVHMGATKHKTSLDGGIQHNNLQARRFELKAYSAANWGNNSDNA